VFDFGKATRDGIRKAQYAGSWYEADGARLSRQLDELLNAAAADSTADFPAEGAALLAIVSPHAGYVFSGKTAAYGYHAGRASKPGRVFVLGPSHHMGFHGAALPNAAAFATPLGDLKVDQEVISELAHYSLFQTLPEVHRVEHSLELQLPFISQAFGRETRIVPIVVGVLDDEPEVRLLAEILKGYVGRNDIVVVSSDFTHYGPRYDYKPFTENARENISRLDHAAFAALKALDLEGFIRFVQETGDTICGFYPLSVLVAMLPRGTQAQLLKYATSQDSFLEDQDNSVSYLAVAFAGPGWPAEPRRRIEGNTIQLSDGERQALMDLARKTLSTYVVESKTITAAEANLEPTAVMQECFGVFVTLYKRSSGAEAKMRALHGGKELRGCIGSIWPVRPLYQAVIENAIASCSRDYRFAPVRKEELDDIDIEISILTPPRRADSYRDIVIGKDGIILSKHQRQAVFLPMVATEFGWDLDETLRQLCLKAGLRPDDWKEGCKFDLFETISLEEKHV
jgi:AmmeMemoRadiSam system protein B/AmmeMemoRadiSam system protein A